MSLRWPWRRRTRFAPPAAAPICADDALLRRALERAPQAAAAPLARAVEDVTARLVAEDLPRNAWLDGGVWAWGAYRGTAAAALRAYQVALAGDEAP
jgi:hypothetical protein